MESLYNNSRPPEHIPRKYFAYVESTEDYSEENRQDSRIFIRFDCLTVQNAESISRKEVITYEFLGEMPQIIIECEASLEKWKIFFESFDLETLENQWFLIETNKAGDLGIVAYECYNDAIPFSGHEITRLMPNSEESELITSLKNKLSLDKFADSNEQELINVLEEKKHLARFVVVANVGQGNLNFMTDERFICAYFDLGGGTGSNSFTYKKENTFVTCQCFNPFVILSHWDMDHIETAIRDISNCKFVWIVPRQSVGKTHFNLALRISATGKLLIWPSYLDAIKRGNLEIIKCIGKSKNDSGLALCVYLSNGDNVLLPGDAKYGSIPFLKNISPTCLVASHHGSDSGNTNVPLARGNSNLVYSYGLKNIWNHPTSSSIKAHKKTNWRNIRYTPVGSVSFTRYPFQYFFHFPYMWMCRCHPHFQHTITQHFGKKTFTFENIFKTIYYFIIR